MVCIVCIGLWNGLVAKEWGRAHAQSTELSDLELLERGRSSGVEKLGAEVGSTAVLTVPSTQEHAGQRGGGLQVPDGHDSPLRSPQTELSSDETGREGPDDAHGAPSPPAVAFADPEYRWRGWLVGGLRSGLWIQEHEDGRLARDGTYQDGMREGQWRRWAPDGRLLEDGHYRSGEKDGVWDTWDSKGRRRSSLQYRNGIPEGRWVLWYSNGQIKECGIYQDGLREGAWLFYDFAGQPDLRTGFYQAGVRRPE